ncbi:terpene cyclase/mutase family protein [Bacillus massiliigorillae]|uniref:terpene cyclase/mutase family protein n=1 Tax=Bacillus massiliigorillae TaxID=1243664 RepID=UPI003F6AFC70
MISQQSIIDNIKARMRKLEEMQTSDGSWRMLFQGPLFTDCLTIILLKTLNIPAGKTIQELVTSIIRLQNENGAWKIYSDEKEGDVSATIQAYAALLLSGRFGREDEEMKRAEHFISNNGGLSKANILTKMMLAVNGLYKYPPLFYFPMTYYLLPSSFPFSMYHCSNYARIHLTPMLICMNKRYVKTHRVDTSFFDYEQTAIWFQTERDSWGEFFIKEIKNMALTPIHMHKAGYQAAEHFMIDRIEENGTLYSYASATFYMIYALLALGYDEKSSIIQKATAGILSYKAKSKNGWHIQNSPSAVWDTALLSYSLQEAGMSADHPVIIKANEYLLKKQQFSRGDWSVNAPYASAGGWGFSDTNTFIPDNDDTSAALRALTMQSKSIIKIKSSWEKGLAYLLAMQNKDGGWGAFEKNAYQPLLAHLPIENAKDALIDDSTADLTGRVLEFLGNYAQMKQKNSNIKRAVNRLMKSQRLDGSWYGKWGVCYIYGSWAAITGLRAVGVEQNHPALIRAARWLESIQREDGGWGESCASAEQETYVPLSFSTPSQTAWALSALLTIRSIDSPSVTKAVQYLLKSEEYSDESISYPTGLGLPGGYYIMYESYNYIFPLLALGQYQKLLLGHDQNLAD